MESDMKWINNHPVSFTKWIPIELIHANDYNPNSVAPPEMKLLQLSIETDGFTQPIVVWENKGEFEVVDGFHRYLVGKKLGLTHLPAVIINEKRSGKGDRMSATIRHNRARGKHRVSAMSDIVIELSRLGKTDAQIGHELGMEKDEVLRLKQIKGLAAAFSDKQFSEAWEYQ